ncbi:ABC transporter ATP-binding protein [Candidatus Frankia alpina]|uniref:ABC transporter ATP-binding protein n=1 Tax=Candidatus Frankia alpina TaxID=2699483 RepID=UPI0013D0DEB0|nr:ABC transporter ATP-binding protein [Candidatus Frankia alpina]
MTVLLQTRGLNAGYDRVPVVRGFDLTLREGEVVALLGPNGAGKTTVLLTLAGLLPALGGEVTVHGQGVNRANPRALSRLGVVLVPDDRSLFTTLTSRENLQLGQVKGGLSVDEVLDYFPALRKRLDVRAGMLTGGEQQMLAIGRAFVQRPRILLIDELSMGLAPVVVQELLPVVRAVATDTSAAVVLVEQHVHLVMGIADHAVVLAHGEEVLAGPAAELRAKRELLERAYLNERHAPREAVA